MSPRVSAGSSVARARRRRFIGRSRRSGAKLACISAVTARATARARGSVGHSPALGAASAAHSAIARLSQITRSSTWSAGMRPVGDTASTSAIWPWP